MNWINLNQSTKTLVRLLNEEMNPEKNDIGDTMDQKQLDLILSLHKLWLETGEVQGQQANFFRKHIEEQLMPAILDKTPNWPANADKPPAPASFATGATMVDAL